jgi:hypothetical protein
MLEAEDDVPAEPGLILVANERAKLTATYINGLAIAMFAVGGLAPVVSALAPGNSLHSVPALALGLFLVGSLASGVLHFVGRLVLGDLRT